MKTTTKLFFICFSLLTASCGFQLRGVDSIGELDAVFVEDRVDIQQLIDQPVSSQIRSDLTTLNAEVADSISDSAPGILITNEEVLERSLSLSANLFNRLIEIEKRISFQILNAEGNVLLADTLVASRELTEDQGNPSAKNQEREILIGSINADLSRQLIRLLDSAIN